MANCGDVEPRLTTREHLGDWFARPLREITRTETRERHELLTEKHPLNPDKDDSDERLLASTPAERDGATSRQAG